MNEGPSAVVEPALVCTEKVLVITPLGIAIWVIGVPAEVTWPHFEDAYT